MHRTVEVSELLSRDATDLQLRLAAGAAGLSKKLGHSRVQKPGLALTGFVRFIHKDRVQIFGSTELAYLDTLSAQERKRAVGTFCEVGVSCIICTKGMELPEELIQACDETETPLLQTPQVTSVFIGRAQTWLEDRLAPQTAVHGVLLDVFGVGVLLLGKSGIGKSESALDLVQKGHRLIADDVVQVRRRGEETVFGSAAQSMFKHHMEIRGLGILNLKDMFGVAAVRERKRVDLVVELVAWQEDEEYDRLGVDERRFPMLDVDLPLITVPVRPGRNMGVIIEVAARNHMLKSTGTDSAGELHERLQQELARGRRVRSDDVD